MVFGLRGDFLGLRPRFQNERNMLFSSGPLRRPYHTPSPLGGEGGRRPDEGASVCMGFILLPSLQTVAFLARAAPSPGPSGHPLPQGERAWDTTSTNGISSAVIAV